MSPALNSLAAAPARVPTPPKPVALPPVELVTVRPRWPRASLRCVGGGLVASGLMEIVGVGWAGAALAVGGAGALASGVVGERWRRQQQLRLNVQVATGPLLGLRGAGSVRARRWVGGYTGLPSRIRLRYSPGALDSNPEWRAEVLATVQRRLNATYSLAQVDPLRCWLMLELRAAAAAAAPEAVVPAAFVRAERTVRELLGVTAAVRASWDGDQLAALAVTHEAGTRVAAAAQRARIERTVSTMLPGRWRADWQLEKDEVLFQLRPQMPSRILHPVYAITDANRYELRLGVDEDGELILWQLRRGQPHLLVVGATGTGKTVAILSVVLQACRRGWAVRICDPKLTEFLGVEDWPNVEILATSTEDMVATIHDTHEEMTRRYLQIRLGQATEDDFEPMVLVLDEYRVMVNRIKAWYARIKTRGMPTACPVLEELAQLGAMGRGAGVHLVMGTQRPDAEFLTGEFRDNFRGRLSLGPLSPEGARMMWDFHHIGVALPRDVPGRATGVGPAGRPVEVQTYWTPDPRRVQDGDVEDRQLLERLRPAGVSHLRLVTVPPEASPEGDDPGFWQFAEAQWVPLVEHPELDPRVQAQVALDRSGRTGRSSRTGGGSEGPKKAGPRWSVPAVGSGVEVDPQLAAEVEAALLGGGGDGEGDVATATPSGLDPELQELLLEAAELVIVSQFGSTSMLQRKMRVGHSKASRLIELLQERGVVGPGNGSRPREVLVKPEALAEMLTKIRDAEVGGTAAVEASSPSGRAGDAGPSAAGQASAGEAGGSEGSEAPAGEQAELDQPGDELDDLDELDEEIDDEDELYGPPEDLRVEEILPGDLVLLDEGQQSWVAVEDIAQDLLDASYWCLDWRSRTDEQGSASIEAGELLTVRHPLEFGEGAR